MVVSDCDGVSSASNDRDLSSRKAGEQAGLRHPIPSESKRRLKRAEHHAESFSTKPKRIRKAREEYKGFGGHNLRDEFSKHGHRVTTIKEKAGALRSTLTKKKKQGKRNSLVQGPTRFVGTAICRFSLIQLSMHVKKSLNDHQIRQSTRVSRTDEGISAANKKAEGVDGMRSVSKTRAKKKTDNKSAIQDHTNNPTGIRGVTDAELSKQSTISLDAQPSTQSCKVAGMDEGLFVGSRKFVVHVSRQEEVEIVRRKLPILMMEQEIMEAIVENPVSIVCGETGCGKTTQVPQFLYEAGFSSSKCNERSGIIGVTQPRRVAVLATAKRVSYEMNLRLGQEVGFQVRHDRKIGENTRIKFMTDGILLREIQSDFLLLKYSVIVLDEVHERSLNTDILIGMLSRILPLRQSLFEEHCNLVKSGRESSGASVFPLKLIIMSATLRIDDFISNRHLFVQPPPVVQVPTRQFPVTVHFSAKTELMDYVGKAYKKVCSIHKKLPPGGVLVFVTSQAEVNYLCRRLQKAFSKFANWKENDKGQNLPSMPLQPSTSMSTENNNIEENMNALDIKMEDILKAVDGGYGYDDFQDEFEVDDQKEMSNSTADSVSECDEEVLKLTDIGQEEAQNDSTFLSPVLLDAIRGAFDAFDGTERDGCNTVMAKPDQTKSRLTLPKVPGPLYVLPLYAMLPAASQLRVFGAVPEGSRLVVVATNVAETSITIPGIRYVVDCGRVKEKMYERASGINRYEVHWISKASAAQRAGRAGRTGSGHCYRLYSSAVFNDIFPEFCQPEIYRAPIESLVLLLKSMGITNVSNFPFATPPDKQALAEAERCLQALSALDLKSGLLTPLGEAMSVYPIGPRHSRMLLTAMQIECACNTSEAYLLLAYAAAAAAALSLDSPLITEREAQGVESKTFAGDSENCNSQSHESGPMPKLHKNGPTFLKIGDQSKSCFDSKQSMHARYRHPFSDALSVVTALRAYEGSKDPEDFCKRNYLHARIMHEMSKLRKQLIHLYFFSSSNSCRQANTPTSGGDVNHVEFVWQEQGTQVMSVKHEKLLRQAICAGWADRVARKISLQEVEKSRGTDEHRKHKTIQYRTCTTNEPVCLHPSSSVRKVAPEFVVYNEIVDTSRPYMRHVTSVDAHWLVLHANALCTFSKPLSDPPPWYDPISDDVFCFVSPSFGPYLWELPLHRFSLKSSKHRIAVFACALLKGRVLPCMASLHPRLGADPSTLLTPVGHAQTRVSELVHVLGAAAVDSRRKLKAEWDTQPGFLFEEILLWVQKDYHSLVSRIWSQLKQEAEQDGGELFKKDRQNIHSERGRGS